MNRRYAHYFIFIFLLCSTLLGWESVWGLLFIFWTIPAYINGEVFFIDMIERNKEPVFFWVVLITWLVLGISMILIDAPLIANMLS